MRVRVLSLFATASLLLLSACAEGGRESITPSAPAETPTLTPRPTVTPGPALGLYCRHALATQAVVTGINEGELQESEAYRRGLEMERLLSADADKLRREKRSIEATSVAAHATAVRQFVDGYIGRGPYAGRDILADYYRASDQARRLCPGYKAYPSSRNRQFLGGQ